MDSYIARLTRREVVGGQCKPEEVILFKFRKEPWSVYFKWLGEEGKGREVVYVKKHYDDKIHTLLAKADVVPLFTPANGQMALAIDSPLVRSASRHSITEAGFGIILERMKAKPPVRGIVIIIEEDSVAHNHSAVKRLEEFAKDEQLAVTHQEAERRN